MKTKYITIPVLSVATALSLSSVAQADHPFATYPTGQTFWVDNEIVYDCNGAGKCINDTYQIIRDYGANAPLETPSSETHKFIGWNLITFRYQKIDNKSCKIWSGKSIKPVTTMPGKIGQLNWTLYQQFDDEAWCDSYKLTQLQYSSNSNDGISGAFFASASWERYYTVNLYLNGGIITGNVLKNVNGDVWIKKYAKSDEFKLPTPTKQGYIFKGWCENKNLTICPTPNLYDGNFNKTYYAKWEKVDFKPLPNLNLNNKLKQPSPIKIKQPITVE